jgi:hypothetical protein
MFFRHVVYVKGIYVDLKKVEATLRQKRPTNGT